MFLAFVVILIHGSMFHLNQIFSYERLLELRWCLLKPQYFDINAASGSAILNT